MAWSFWVGNILGVAKAVPLYLPDSLTEGTKSINKHLKGTWLIFQILVDLCIFAILCWFGQVTLLKFNIYGNRMKSWWLNHQTRWIIFQNHIKLSKGQPHWIPFSSIFVWLNPSEVACLSLMKSPFWGCSCGISFPSRPGTATAWSARLRRAVPECRWGAGCFAFTRTWLWLWGKLGKACGFYWVEYGICDVLFLGQNLEYIAALKVT